MSKHNNLHNNPHLELPPQVIPPQRQQQQQIASVYPKLPSQEELPTYTPYVVFPTPQNEPQQSEQFIKQPFYPQQQPLYPQQQPYNNNNSQQPCIHHHPQQQPMYYGSIPAPNISSPAPIPPQNNHQQTLTVQPTTNLRTKSELVECPHCHQLVYTVLDYDVGLCTGLSIAGLFLAGCNNGLCLLPWLFPWTKDVTHQCPSCKEKIATFTRLERDTRLRAAPVGL